MSETNSMQPRTSAPIPALPPGRAPLPAEQRAKKRYEYVRIRVCMPSNLITTISLDPDLVKQAARVLGSERKARDLAQSAALQYVEGQSPARTRSSFAARALMRAINGGAGSLP